MHINNTGINWINKGHLCFGIRYKENYYLQWRLHAMKSSITLKDSVKQNTVNKTCPQRGDTHMLYVLECF